mmetsp:Transcript_47147/g.137099  ORF Transcript_47147/g.137099 Transcript_47147/m.137099 type:complete len:294 (-) Transcript_47147:169-1050(-)
MVAAVEVDPRHPVHDADKDELQEQEVGDGGLPAPRRVVAADRGLVGLLLFCAEAVHQRVRGLERPGGVVVGSAGGNVHDPDLAARWPPLGLSADFQEDPRREGELAVREPLHGLHPESHRAAFRHPPLHDDHGVDVALAQLSRTECVQLLDHESDVALQWIAPNPKGQHLGEAHRLGVHILGHRGDLRRLISDLHRHVEIGYLCMRGQVADGDVADPHGDRQDAQHLAEAALQVRAGKAFAAAAHQPADMPRPLAVAKAATTAEGDPKPIGDLYPHSLFAGEQEEDSSAIFDE